MSTLQVDTKPQHEHHALHAALHFDHCSRMVNLQVYTKQHVTCANIWPRIKWRFSKVRGTFDWHDPTTSRRILRLLRQPPSLKILTDSKSNGLKPSWHIWIGHWRRNVSQIGPWKLFQSLKLKTRSFPKKAMNPSSSNRIHPYTYQISQTCVEKKHSVMKLASSRVISHHQNHHQVLLWRLGFMRTPETSALIRLVHCWAPGANGHLGAWDMWKLPYPTNLSLVYWLVVYLSLWKMSVRQLGWLFPIYGQIKNRPNRQPVSLV